MSDPVLPRERFPITDRCTYLDHAAVAPLSLDAARATDRATLAWLTEGGRANDNYEEQAEAVRGSAATLMGCHRSEVAFVKNTTEGLAFVANGLSWEPGDRIVIPGGEFPSTLYPFLALERLGVEVVQIPPGEHGALPFEAFEAAVAGGRTRLVVASWVQYATGWRVDPKALAALSHDHGALFCLDVIQGLGLLPCHLTDWGVDFAMADSHKWMLGPQGIGVLHVAREHLGRIRVSEPGWNAVATRSDYDRLLLDYDETARRFEGGTHNLTGIVGMGASVDLLLTTNADDRWAHVDSLCGRARAGLDEGGATIHSVGDPDHRSGIVTFSRTDERADETFDRLDNADVVVSRRGPGIRLSPHAYNNLADIDRLLEVALG